MRSMSQVSDHYPLSRAGALLRTISDQPQTAQTVRAESGVGIGEPHRPKSGRAMTVSFRTRLRAAPQDQAWVPLQRIAGAG